MMERARGWLLGIALATGGLVGAGWVLHRFGALPPGLTGWANPLLAAGFAACTAGGLIPFVRRQLTAPRLRWWRRTVAVSMTIAAGIHVATRIDRTLEETLSLEPAILLLLVVGGAALLYDSWDGWVHATLPRIGVGAGMSAGTGLLLLGAAEWAGAWAAWCAAAGVLGVGAGGFAGSFARREIQRDEAALLAPPG